MKQTVAIFGSISVAIILLFQLSKWSVISTRFDNDILIILSGCLFIVIGFLVSRVLYVKKSGPEENDIDVDQLAKTSLSKQEYKVFQLMAEGFSNIEIAKKLFISESTVKTHVSKVLVKLNAKRRTEAVKIGRDLNIL